MLVGSGEVLIEGSTFENNNELQNIGTVHVGRNTNGSLSVHASNFVLNGQAVFNQNNTSIVPISSSFFGSESGPFHPITNLTGAGDSVSVFVSLTDIQDIPVSSAAPLRPVHLDAEVTGVSALVSWSQPFQQSVERYNLLSYPSELISEGLVEYSGIDTSVSVQLPASREQRFYRVYSVDDNQRRSSYSAPLSIRANTAPFFTQLAPISMLVGGDVETIAMDTVFVDPDGDLLSYSHDTPATGIIEVDITDGILRITATQKGIESFTITAIDEFGASASMDVSVSVPTGVLAENLSSKQTPEVFIFPNPVSQQLKIRVAGISGAYQILAYDALGRSMPLKFVTLFDEANSTILVDISGLNAGLYWIQLRGDRGSYTRSVIVVQ